MQRVLVGARGYLGAIGWHGQSHRAQHPVGRVHAERRVDGRLFGAAAHRRNRLEQRHVGLTAPVVLDALSAADACTRPGRTTQIGERRVDERRLPDPGFAGDEGDLSPAARRGLKPLADRDAFRRPADEAAVLRRDAGGAQGLGPGVGAAVGHEPVPPPRNRLDEARPPPFVLQRFPELADRLTGDVLRDRDVAPHRIEQCLLAHQLAGTLRQVPQHGKGFGSQADGHSIAVELSGSQIEPERRKVDRGGHPNAKSSDLISGQPSPFQLDGSSAALGEWQVSAKFPDSLRTRWAAGRYQAVMTSDTPGTQRFADPGAPLPVERAFVIQLRAPAASGGELFVGRAEHIASGVATRFGCVTELLDFVRQVLSARAPETQQQEGENR